MTSEVVLAGACRTPVGGFCGALAEVPATKLGSLVIQAVLARTGVKPEKVDEVILGNVIGAGLGQNPARQAALGAGLPVAVSATTVNKVCGSGLKAVMMGIQAIRCGDAAVVVAGGTENMSRAPFLLDRARTGYRLGNGTLIDAVLHDGLRDAYHDKPMGGFGELCGQKYTFSRKDQDDYAVQSYQLALEAMEKGRFQEEIVPVEVPHKKGTLRVTEDEEPKRFNEEKLRSLKPAFEANGTITAGNASSINDGAAAVLVLPAEQARGMGVAPMARVLGYHTAADAPEWFTVAPVKAMAGLLDKLGLAVSEVDLFEVNEAFAVVPMAAMKDLGIPREKLNVNGGAVAMGHPIGASGARTLVTLLHAMRQRGSRRGMVSLCIGGGEAVALAVEAI